MFISGNNVWLGILMCTLTACVSPKAPEDISDIVVEEFLVPLDEVYTEDENAQVAVGVLLHGKNQFYEDMYFYTNQDTPPNEQTIFQSRYEDKKYFSRNWTAL